MNICQDWSTSEDGFKIAVPQQILSATAAANAVSKHYLPTTVSAVSAVSISAPAHVGPASTYTDSKSRGLSVHTQQHRSEQASSSVNFFNISRRQGSNPSRSWAADLVSDSSGEPSEQAPLPLPRGLGCPSLSAHARTSRRPSPKQNP